ncbi:hypothetical protein DRH27_03400, partial [Candidatus Falkowbacteria bacterium]
AGLKAFKKNLAREIKVKPTPWTFDLEFLLKAKNYGYVIGTVDIVFDKRTSGESKINISHQIFEIGWNSLKLKFKKRHPLLIRSRPRESMLGAGIAHNKKRFITHTTLEKHNSAFHTFTFGQKIFFYFLAAIFINGLIRWPLATGIFAISFLNVCYFIDMAFNLSLIFRSLKNPPEIIHTNEELTSLNDADLPVYSILCPLYKEAEVLPNFLKAIDDIDWPDDKKDVLLLLEENDRETINAAQALNLPGYVRVITVPHSQPKTKPKACNYGLFFARGEFLVIYDAEDIPDPKQLKKAYLGFNKLPSNVRCLQAKLNYYNADQNLLTRLFTAEYSLWFDVVLPGLQTINTTIPLGGTSNHFRTQDLMELEGWDPFNVTEDCDLGIRIFKCGFKTAIIDSVTLEEANSRINNWLRQRSRWIKGYMQTYLVHMRQPLKLIKENGIHAFIFQLIVGGKVAFMIINPLLWITTISYFTFNSITGPTIESLFPPSIFYLATTSLILGNFLYIYYYMIGCARRGHWHLIKYVFFIPFYWIMISLASLIAAYQLFVKPHYWEKTHHGLHLKKRKKLFYFPGLTRRLSALRLPSFNFIKINFKKLNPKLFKLLFSGEMVFIAGLMISNVINFVFNAYLGRVLSYAELGLVTLINTLWYLTMIFVNSFAATVNAKVSYLLGKKNKQSGAAYRQAMLKKAMGIVLAFSFVWILAVPYLTKFFNINSFIVLLLFSPVFTFGIMIATNRGYLQGIFKFKYSAYLYVFESIIKLGAAAVLVTLGLSHWVHAAIPLSIIGAALLSILLAKKETPEFTPLKSLSFPKKFLTASLMTNVSAMVYLSVDMLLVKHFLSPEIAGKYALLSLAGKMVFFLGALPSMFLMSFISKKEGQQGDPKKIYKNIYILTFLLTGVSVIFIGPLGYFFIPLLFGQKALAITQYLLTYSLAIGIFTIANAVILYHLARRHYAFSFVSLFSSILLILGISLWHNSIGEVVNVIFIISTGTWLVIEAMHAIDKRAVFLKRGFVDLLGAFQKDWTMPKTASPKLKNILIFNWRDTHHKFTGGAETYIQEISKLWVKDGHGVTIFCGNDGHSPRNDIVEGVKIIRRGGFYLVYVWAFLYYILRLRKKYDIIIDCQNGIPFFTPLYVKKPIYCLMHHVHQEVFRKSLNKPLAMLAMFLEKKLMPLVYRSIPFITVSESSKKEMLAIGLGKKEIHIVHPGINSTELFPGAKSAEPLVLYLGRLKAYKSIDNLIKAFKTVAEKIPRARLVIAGSGEEKNRLKELARNLGLDINVTFTGRVSDEKKLSLLQHAWVSINPSYMEGWGITTIEANACGTPVIASDVPGLRDSVINPHTGFLVEYNNINSLSEKIIKLINDRPLREEMSRAALEWSKKFNWQQSSRHFFSFLDYDHYKSWMNNKIRYHIYEEKTKPSE